MHNLGPESIPKELPGESNPTMTWADQFLQVTGSDRIDSASHHAETKLTVKKEKPHSGTSAGSACKPMLGWCGTARRDRPGCY